MEASRWMNMVAKKNPLHAETDNSSAGIANILQELCHLKQDLDSKVV